MALQSTDFARIAALDAAYAFLEEPEVSLPLDMKAGGVGAPLVGIKSNIKVRGQSWTAGIGGRRDLIADEDAEVVKMLRRAGIGVLSRLNMDEAALGAACRNPAYRTTMNPAAPGCSPGGSSGGSAAAVAAGACGAALGTDTLGSVRIPAAYCGVFGLKLGRDAVSMEGVFPLAPSLDALGVLGQSTDDIREILTVCGVPAGETGLTVARIEDTPSLGMAPSVLQALETAEAALLDAGAEVKPVSLGLDLGAVRSDAFLKTEIEAAGVLAGEKGLSAGLEKLLNYGAGIPAQAREEIGVRLAEAGAGIAGAVSRGGCLLLPTVGEAAFPLGAQAPRGQADFTAPANVAGLPAIAIPMPSEGLPVSVQLVGPRGSEWAILALADQITGRH